MACSLSVTPKVCVEFALAEELVLLAFDTVATKNRSNKLLHPRGDHIHVVSEANGATVLLKGTKSGAFV